MALPPDLPGRDHISHHPDLAGIEVQEVLRDRPSHAVYAVTKNERPYFMKIFRAHDAADQVRRTVDTLSSAANALGQAENAVVRLRFAFPDAGAILLDPVHGIQLTTLIAAASLPRRNALIARAGSWLSKLTAERETGSFGDQFWLRGINEKFDQSCDRGADRKLLESQIKALMRLGKTISGAPVSRAVSHGDFTPDNIYLEGPRLIGIDMQRPVKLAVARDVARFLVWLQSRRSGETMVMRHGVSASDFAALTRVPRLIAPDQDGILQFMIGEIMIGYYLDAGDKPMRRRALAAGMRHWQDSQAA